MQNYRSQIGIGLLFLALLFSLGANFYLYQKGSQYYLELNRTRLDPLGLRYDWLDNGLTTANPGKQRVLFFGDSRAEQWNNPADFERFEFLNRGIGAQTTEQILGRFSSHVAPLKPDIVVIQLGINDLKTIPLFPERKNQIIADCKINIQKIVEQSLQGGAEVILTTIFPLGEISLDRSFFWSEDVALAIKDVNRSLLSLQGERVQILDTALVLADEGAIVKAEFRHDFLHLNANGYAALNQELSNLLDKY